MPRKKISFENYEVMPRDELIEELKCWRLRFKNIIDESLKEYQDSLLSHFSEELNAMKKQEHEEILEWVSRVNGKINGFYIGAYEYVRDGAYSSKRAIDAGVNKNSIINNLYEYFLRRRAAAKIAGVLKISDDGLLQKMKEIEENVKLIEENVKLIEKYVEGEKNA